MKLVFSKVGEFILNFKVPSKKKTERVIFEKVLNYVNVRLVNIQLFNYFFLFISSLLTNVLNGDHINYTFKKSVSFVSLLCRKI